MEGGNRNAILLDVDAVLQGVGCSDLSGCVLRGHVCGLGVAVGRGRGGGRGR